MVAGASGGKTSGSKVIMSPLCASNNAWRKVPEPLSAVLLTIMVSPFGNGVGVDSASVFVNDTVVVVGDIDVGMGISGTAVGEESSPQQLIARGKVITRRNSIT